MPTPLTKLQTVGILSIPLFGVLYTMLLPALAQAKFYGDDTTFANDPSNFPNMTISVSLYIATAQASGAFATLNTPPLAYMWLNPLIARVTLRSVLVALSLILFDITWFLFLVTPITENATAHIVFVAMFIGSLLLHFTGLLLITVFDTPRIKIIDISLYAIVIACLLGLGIVAGIMSTDADVGYWFYIFEVLS